VLAGTVAGVTVAVIKVDEPTTTDEGVAEPVTESGVGPGFTVSEIEEDAVLSCASLALIGRLFAPEVVASGTFALNEKTLSPAVTSPFVPLSNNTWLADPPIVLRSAVAVIPVLAGPAAGVTVAVIKVLLPAVTGDGLAAPVTDRGVPAPTVSEIEVDPVLDCASVIVTGSDFGPVDVAPGTLALNEKMLSPIVTSPFVPSSKNV